MENKFFIISFLVAAFFSLTFSSCSEDVMDDINRYEANPFTVQTQFIISDILTQTAFSVTGGDFSTYASVYTEHEGGVHNQLYNAETRAGEPSSTSTYNNAWRQVYRNIRNAKIVIDRTTTGDEAESNISAGVAKILLAYNAAILTDLFGDVPYSQAGLVDERGLPVYLQPKVDKQVDIYADILKQLDEGITLLGTGERGPIGLSKANDYIYGSDEASWIRAAYGLKARYTMRLINRSANVDQDLENILTFINQSFASADQEFKFALYDGDSNLNPLSGFSYSRYGLGASQSFVNKLKERNDPRLTQMFIPKYGSTVPVSDPSKLVLVPNGDVPNITQSQTFYSRMITDYSSSAPTQLLSYHELLFLKAEAYARLGKKGDAETALKEAIAAGFANLANAIQLAHKTGDIKNLPENFDLSGEVSEAYYNGHIKALFDAAPLKEIMNQKYLAFAGASGESVEAYNDIRRLKGAEEEFILLENKMNAENRFPYRYTYGDSDATTNPNIESLVGDGTYVYSSRVWWAGGDR